MNKTKTNAKTDPEPREIYTVIIAESDDWSDAKFDVQKTAEKVSELFYISCIKGYLAKKRCEFTLLLTDDHNIKNLNKQFRGKDMATNVLSFPQYHLVNGDLTQLEDENELIVLGDIAMSWQTFDSECIMQGKEPLEHFSHLLLHSLLHLIGYDHEEEADAKEMEELEINLLAKINLNNPYTK